MNPESLKQETKGDAFVSRLSPEIFVQVQAFGSNRSQETAL